MFGLTLAVHVTVAFAACAGLVVASTMTSAAIAVTTAPK
jgi:hypothetical protein